MVVVVSTTPSISSARRTAGIPPKNCFIVFLRWLKVENRSSAVYPQSSGSRPEPLSGPAPHTLFLFQLCVSPKPDQLREISLPTASPPFRLKMESEVRDLLGSRMNDEVSRVGCGAEISATRGTPQMAG